MLEASGYKLSLQFNVIISKWFSNEAPACDYDNNISTYLNINLGIYLLNTYSQRHVDLFIFVAKLPVT